MFTNKKKFKDVVAQPNHIVLTCARFDSYLKQKGVAQLAAAFLDKALEGTLLNLLADYQKKVNPAEYKITEQYFYASRLTAIASIDNDHFQDVPFSCQVEFLLTRRISGAIKGFWREEMLNNCQANKTLLIEMIARNNYSELDYANKQWVTKNIKQIIDFCQAKRRKQHLSDQELWAGIFKEYRKAFNITGSTLNRITSKNGKRKIPLMFEISRQNPDLSASDCTRLAIKYYKTWKDVLAEAIKIQKENPDLSASDCKRLAIVYYKTWKDVLAEAVKIKKENPGLSASDCTTLAIKYYKTWKDVLDEVVKIKKENPGLSASDCTTLVIKYYKTWKKVLAEAVKIKKANPGLSASDCKRLAIHYYKTWKKVLASNATITKKS